MSLDDVRHTVLIAVIILWVFRKHKDHPWNTILGLVLTLIALTEFGALILLKLNISNHWLYNLFTLLNVFTSMVLIAQLGRISRRIPYGVLSLVGIVMLYHVMSGPGFMILDGGSAVIAGFLLAGFSAFGLFRLADMTSAPLMSRPEFWILSAYLVYYLCFSPIIGLVTYIAGQSRDLALTLLMLNDILFILHFLMIGYAIMIMGRTKAQPIING